MTCQKLFNGAKNHRKELDAPVRIFPSCHPKAAVEVFIDSKNKEVILGCAKCDRVIDRIKVKGLINGNVDQPGSNGA